jgi:hypothetical protein
VPFGRFSDRVGAAVEGHVNVSRSIVSGYQKIVLGGGRTDSPAGPSLNYGSCEKSSPVAGPGGARGVAQMPPRGLRRLLRVTGSASEIASLRVAVEQARTSTSVFGHPHFGGRCGRRWPRNGAGQGTCLVLVLEADDEDRPTGCLYLVSAIDRHKTGGAFATADCRLRFMGRRTRGGGAAPPPGAA